MATEERAREVLKQQHEHDWPDGAFDAEGDVLAATAVAAMLALAAEVREDCARIVDRHDTGDCTREDMEARRIAAAIRAQGGERG